MVNYTEVRDVWVEVQIDGDTLGLSLIAETDSGAVVQRVEGVSADEIEERAGDIFTMNLSDRARKALSGGDSDFPEISDEPDTAELLEYMGLTIEEGDVVRDTDAPSWSEDDRVYVTEVTDTPAEDYPIEEGPHGNHITTVATENPDFRSDALVVKGRYLDENGMWDSKEYAFPSTRLKQITDDEPTPAYLK